MSVNPLTGEEGGKLFAWGGRKHRASAVQE
jgi:hypothetical protein